MRLLVASANRQQGGHNPSDDNPDDRRMPRYKGRTSTSTIETIYPHVVEIAVPENGLGTRLDAMYVWCRSRGITPHHGQQRHEEGQDFIAFCFAVAQTAAGFAAAFEGNVRP